MTKGTFLAMVGFHAKASDTLIEVPDLLDRFAHVLEERDFQDADHRAIATVLLIMTGITTVESLTSKRPYIFVGCFVIGMLVTPPDVISQTILALPMYALFELGILFGRLVQKDAAKKSDEEEATE